MEQKASHSDSHMEIKMRPRDVLEHRKSLTGNASPPGEAQQLILCKAVTDRPQKGMTRSYIKGNRIMLNH